MTSRAVISSDSRRASAIRSFLHVGGIASLSPQTLSKFSTTINLIAGFRLSAPPQMRVVHIPLDDDENQDLSAYWTTVFQIIDDERKSGGKVLLLCAMGISRSATFAIAYLMCRDRLTLHDAYKEVQRRRNIICPNIGFFKQMIELEEKFYKRNTVRIIEPLDGVPVADVVWNELYDEMLQSMSSTNRDVLRTLHPSASSMTMRELSLNLESPTEESPRPLKKSASGNSILRDSSRGSSSGSTSLTSTSPSSSQTSIGQTISRETQEEILLSPLK
ncbi:unnamed protein product, partial [Mesorhabditis belari]|uniref:Protein-tyrosine-phosphatase n=1 Tax=Mesorhabditis belari TaxID=2138241 RepID=A0AAF3FTU7_9BILA